MATAVIINKSNLTRKVESKDYFKLKIVSPERIVRINETLPFRVKFTNIIIPGYNANNVPGIGLQVIEYSNYIL
jgi:hypothetical protein